MRVHGYVPCERIGFPELQSSAPDPPASLTVVSLLPNVEIQQLSPIPTKWEVMWSSSCCSTAADEGFGHHRGVRFSPRTPWFAVDELHHRSYKWLDRLIRHFGIEVQEREAPVGISGRFEDLLALPYRCGRDAGFGIACCSGQCYLSSTLFQTSCGDYKLAHRLKVGDRIRSSSGGEIEVEHIWVYQRQLAQVVDLKTSQAQLTLSVGHRMVVPELKSSNRVISTGEKLSHLLSLGDEVVVGALAQKIVRPVKVEDRWCILVDVCFSPDHPVEAKMEPPHGIVTKGSESDIRTDDGFD
eukprot:gnl/TRDRNA2_/TRDRNA2_160033_c0_seq2.p1 gnl/TRDRNA2_/TRDRNA2_160033_c0~~gnl/TRDRNA2_/TRDRNA2_160033_c0_seq2.p1  ORF type:complete len:298 (-),score=27.67 gnl/TRDRNA2_/TRDRNA2_160033_c0_seq2:599-1492(-)